MARPKQTEKLICVRLTESTFKRLRTVANYYGVSYSKLIDDSLNAAGIPSSGAISELLQPRAVKTPFDSEQLLKNE